MKRICIMLLLTIGSYTLALAQQQPSHQIDKATTAEYVSVSVRSFLVRKNYTAYLNYGDSDERSGHILDMSGEKQEFSNPMGVMKFMAKQGWHFVAFISDDDGKITDRSFLMKRELPFAN